MERLKRVRATWSGSRDAAGSASERGERRRAAGFGDGALGPGMITAVWRARRGSQRKSGAAAAALSMGRGAGRKVACGMSGLGGHEE